MKERNRYTKYQSFIGSARKEMISFYLEIEKDKKIEKNEKNKHNNRRKNVLRKKQRKTIFNEDGERITKNRRSSEIKKKYDKQTMAIE